MKPVSEKNITISDIARQANVSKATVSRVINNRPYVKEEVKKRVWEIIERTNFKPNIIAQSLSTKRSNIIGVILPEIDTGFFSELLQNLDQEAKKENLFLLISFAKNGQLSDTIENFISSKVVRNFILVAPQINKNEIRNLKYLSEKIILIGGKASYDICSINFENYEKSFEITNHLIWHGYREIGIIMGPEENEDAKERAEGFKSALSSNGIPLKEEFVERGNFTEESGYYAMKKIFKRGKLPEAIFCCNDAMAIGAIKFLKEKDINVPWNIAIAGFDGIKMGKYFGLTTVKVPFYRTGKIAISQILKKEKNRSIKVKCELLIRSSCGCKNKEG